MANKQALLYVAYCFWLHQIDSLWSCESKLVGERGSVQLF